METLLEAMTGFGMCVWYSSSDERHGDVWHLRHPMQIRSKQPAEPPACQERGGGEMLLHCRLSRSPLGMGLGTSAAMETRQARLAAVQLLPILARSGDVQAALCVTAAPAARHPQCY